MAFWPFRKRSKTNSGERRSETPLPPEVPPKALQDPEKSSTNQNTERTGPKRSVSKRSSRLMNHIQSFTNSPTIEDFPLPPNAAGSPLQTESNQKPAANLAGQENDPQRSESSASSHRPHKRNVFRRTSQRFSNTQVTRLRDIAGNDNGPLSPASNRDNPFLSPEEKAEEKALEAGNSIPERFGRRLTLKHRRAFSEKPRERTNFRDSVQSTSSEHSSIRAFRVRSLDVLSPRPKLRLADSPPLAEIHKYPTFEDMKGGYEWRSALRLPINEEPNTMKMNRVYGLADALDSRGIRDALERDARRKERKAREDEARAQAKLERKAEKQKAEAEEAQRELDKVLQKQQEANLLNSIEAAKVVVGVLHDAALPSETLETIRPTTSDSKEVSAGARTPMSWVGEVSQEDISKQPKKPPALNLKHKKDVSQSSQDTSNHYSPDSDYPDETHIETARAVRLSTCTVSPPPSPSLVRSPTLIHHSPSHTRNPSRDLSQNINALASQPTQDDALASAWGSFFKKATNARIQKEHQAAAEAYRTPPPEERDAHGIQNHISAAVPVVSQEADQPLTPEQSQASLSRSQSYEHSVRSCTQALEHPGPLPLVGMTSLTRSKTDARIPSSHRITPPAIPNSPGKSLTEQPNHASKHFSDISYYNNPSSSRSSIVERASEMARSMASLESEGSWLSGKLNPRQSFSPIRNSAASLRHRYRDIEGHEDKRASVADDEYFSGVPRQSNDESVIQDSDEEELAILDSYTNDQPDFASPTRSTVVQPVPVRQTAILAPLVSPQIEDGQTFKIEDDQGTWREGLGRRPTITRVDSALAKRRERLADVYQARDLKSSYAGADHLDGHPLYPMRGEVFSADELPDVPDRGRDSPSPTLGRGIAM